MSKQQDSLDAALAKAREWQRVYETVLANTPDFIYVIGLDKRIVYANKALLETWGRTAEQTVGRRFIELGYEQWHADMHEAEIGQVITTRKAVRNKIPFTGTNGRRIYDYIFAPVLDDKGEITAIAGTTRDITENEETEQALARSEARMSLALEASEFVGTWDWDMQTDLVTADERFARLYSVDPELAAKGTRLDDFTAKFHPEDLLRVGPEIERVTREGGLFSEEYRLIQQDGSIRWVVAKGRVLLDAEGQPLRFSGVAIDITERKLAEQRMLESQRALQQMADALPQQVWTAQPDGQIDYINGHTRQYAGDIRIEDGVIQWLDVVYAGDVDKSVRIWKNCIATGAPYEAEQRIYHAGSGQYRWNLSRALPLHDADGRIIKWFGTNTDIEDQKKAAAATSEARAYLKLMLDSAEDYAIISMTEKGEITSWSTGAERIFGYQEAETIGEMTELIFTPEDRRDGAPQRELEMAAVRGRATDERWHIRKTGERFYASGIMAAMRDEHQQLRGFIKIARDMTSQQEAQQALIEARNAAEAANIAKTEFLANMSHEIRTPMNAVIGLSNILALSEPLTEKQRNFIKTLQMSADSLLNLINDLLDIAKIEARSVSLEKVPLSLPQILQEIISMMAVRVREKGLDFTSDDDCVAHRLFLGDPTRLRQIILNLCSNAVKFTEQGGVHVGIGCHPTSNSKIEMICIAVTDTGIGIAPGNVANIFEKFVQADSSINRKYGGTGLGLAITKTLTEIMGGTLKVESCSGQGSTFTACIPLEIAEDETGPIDGYPEPELKKENHSPRKSQRVLLVEDYAANVLVASIFLEQFGYGFDVASNGLEAIEKVKTGNYGVVLMDVQMHGMNGLEATQLIRDYERRQGKIPLPIIGMTAHALAGDRERCISAGMDDYIAKPFNPAELQEKLAELVEEKAGVADLE